MEVNEFYNITEGGVKRIGWKLIKEEGDEEGQYYQFEHPKYGTKVISGKQIGEHKEFQVTIHPTKKPELQNLPFNNASYQSIFANPDQRTLNTRGKIAKEEKPYFGLVLNALDEAYLQQKAAEAAAGPRPPPPPRNRPVFEEPGFRPTKGGRRKTKKRKTTKRRKSRSRR